MYEAPPKPAERDHRRGRRTRPGDQALVHSDPAWGAALMEAVSLTERDVAGTFRAMAQTGGGEAAARRLRLADAAIRGSREAAERARLLQRLGSQEARQARNAARQADRAALLRALHRAGPILAELAAAETDIARALAKLAEADGSELAARQRGAAEVAVAAAQSARDRARVLRKLAD
jgi:hypothetical protein